MSETPDCRNRRWETTHGRILSVALDLFEDFGFEQVSVGQIATRAGVSVPTFYAHYPSKDHLVIGLPTPEQVQAMHAGQPAGLPVAEQVLRANLRWISGMPPEEFAQLLTRWRIIAGTPGLRTRVAGFERETAGMVLRNLSTAPGTMEVVHASAALAATTVGLLAWADSNGERPLDETLDEAFRALSG